MILDIMIMPVCLICEREVSYGICCDKCFFDLNKDFNDFDRTRSLGVAKAISVFVYSDRTKKLIENFKYSGFKRVGKFFAQLMAYRIENNKLFKKDAIIVPIPTSKARIRERGFDHTDFLASELSKLTNLKYKKLIFCKSYKISQTKVKDRWENSKNKFIGIDVPEYKNYQIILIDDVITTGSTMISAIKVLNELGYNDIVCLSVAMKF